MVAGAREDSSAISRRASESLNLTDMPKNFEVYSDEFRRILGPSPELKLFLPT